MLTSIKNFDTTTASIGKKPENSFIVRILGESVSVRELIRLRIFQEVEEHNQRQPEVSRMLVQRGEARAHPEWLQAPQAAIIVDNMKLVTMMIVSQGKTI